MSNHLSNADFLDQYLRGDIEGAILPLERDLVEKKIGELTAEQERLTSEKLSVSGGDDWHDGAFRATDNAAVVLSGQHGKLSEYLNATIVDFPEADETRVSLGSRVTLDQSGDVYDVEIVGVPFLHEAYESDTLMLCSIESPVAKGIIGKVAGHVATLHVGRRRNQVTVVEVDQISMKGYLDDELSK